MKPLGPQNVGAAGLRAQEGSFLAAFYLKARMKLPRIPSTLKYFAVLRHRKDSEKLMMILRREKAQGWGLISISCLLWLFHTGLLSTFTPSMAQAFIRNLPNAGEAGGPGPVGLGNWVVWTGWGSGHAVGLLSLGDLGHFAGTISGMEASARSS